MRRVMSILGVCLLGLLAAIFWMAGGDARHGIHAITPRTVGNPPAPEATATSTLTIVSWNIAWAFGWGSELKKDAPIKTKADLDAALDVIGRTLTELRADVVLLQEVDFGADRSFGVDQAQVLAEKTGLSYVAPVISWDLRYLPFPYWPPSRHAGRMRSGGAILSRFPVSDCTGELLDKPASQAFWYRAFYLFRYAQRCTVTVGDRPLLVINAHLEAFDRANREIQAEHLATRLRAAMMPALIFGGDLNSVVPEAPVRTGYPDEPETDHREDRTLTIFRGVEGLTPAFSPEAIRAEPSRYFTFPSHAPNRGLDHLFVGRGFRVLEARVVSEAGTTSDHLPVLARVTWVP
ncbi:MAG: endonuclease/exonuclease/phosphatase family protein [Deltaproteobacteria bacterium]|nr:endonuclease/exonuclease/phosphatase family protein [Deltaproteobacteria bacterium]